MAITEMPRALTKEEFNRRVALLKKLGKPLTMENIDPVFMKEFHKGTPLANLFKRFYCF